MNENLRADSFVETVEYLRFAEFCDACPVYRPCHGPPGVGKTLSARRYAEDDRLEGPALPQTLSDGALEILHGMSTVFPFP